MKNIFVVYIGGSCEGALIELHDIRIVIGAKIEDTYALLTKSWWGNPESLHLDAWGVLNWADGHSIEVVDSVLYTSQNQSKLYFLNLGGYDSKQFTELHKNVFVVAKSAQEAKIRALKHIENWELSHRDYQFDIDKILNVSDLFHYKVKLMPCATEIPFEFICKYVPIGKTSTLS